MKMPRRPLLFLALAASAAAALIGYWQRQPEQAPITQQAAVPPALPQPAEPPTATPATTTGTPSQAPAMRLAVYMHRQKLHLGTRRSDLAIALAPTSAPLPAAAVAAPAEQRLQATGGDTAQVAAAPSAPPLPHSTSAAGKPETNPAEKKAETTYAFGAGIEHMPRWFGAARHKNEPIPYININWQDRIEFSTVNGLRLDVLHLEKWRAGIVGTMTWGRSDSDLGPLSAHVTTLKNTLQAGVYAEYLPHPAISVGARLRRDLQNTGVKYADVYVSADLPAPGPIEHSLTLSREAMNTAGMRRFFGVDAAGAQGLGVQTYQPKGGTSRHVVGYEAFIPTSQSTGIALGANFSRLATGAADSPLVRNFGSPWQREAMAAFIYHF